MLRQLIEGVAVVFFSGMRLLVERYSGNKKRHNKIKGVTIKLKGVIFKRKLRVLIYLWIA